MTKQKSAATALAHGKRQAARRDEIDNFSIARQFGDHAHQSAALERFFHRPQCIERIRNFEDQKLPCRQTERIAARAINAATFRGDNISLNPKRFPAVFGGARSQGKSKAHGRAQMARCRRRYFMQAGGGQATLQNGIDRPHAQRPRTSAGLETGFLRTDLRDSMAQTAKGG